jgi:hypothetical protein
MAVFYIRIFKTEKMISATGFVIEDANMCGKLKTFVLVKR